jgi:hypothetical protein
MEDKMAKNDEQGVIGSGATVEETEFPIGLNEFLNGLKGEVETKNAFLKLAKEEAGIRRTRDEWQKIYELFRTKPMGVSWPEWRKSNLKGE